MSTLLQWEIKNQQKFEELDFQKDIIPVIRRCYEIAIEDTDNQSSYTKMVLENIAIITNKEPMSITYKQWKSLNAYLISWNKSSVDTSKLYNNER